MALLTRRMPSGDDGRLRARVIATFPSRGAENRAGSVRAARFCVFASHCFAGRSAHNKCLIDIN